MLEGVTSFLLTNLVPVVLGLLASVIGALITNAFIRRAVAAEHHLSELKRDVLQSMLDHLTARVLPVLEIRVGNVGLGWTKHRQPSAPITDESVRHTETFAFARLSEPPMHPGDITDDPTPSNPLAGDELYRDACQNHFRTLCETWEEMLANWDAYNAACITYAEKLRSELVQATELPEWHPRITQPPWIHAAQLALVVFYRQLELAPHKVERTLDGDLERFVYKNSVTLAIGPKANISRLTDVLNTQITRRAEIDKLLKDAKSIKEDLLRIKAEIERLLLKRRLRGACPYLA